MTSHTSALKCAGPGRLWPSIGRRGTICLGNPGNDRTLMRIFAPVVMDAVPAPGRKAALGSVAAVIPPALRTSSW